jgi:hypothetical protein
MIELSDPNYKIIVNLFEKIKDKPEKIFKKQETLKDSKTENK